MNVDNGGICVNGHGESSVACSGEKLQVNFKFIELIDGIVDVQKYKDSIDEYVKDIGHSEDNVPHFIISPGSKEMAEYLARSTSFFDEIQTMQGFDIFIVGNTNNYNINDYKYQFMLLPLMQYEQMGFSSIDLMKNRYKARSYVILLDKEASEKTQIIMDGYISERENEKDMKYLIKRCESQISDPDGINCVNSNCNNKTDSCSFPKIDLTVFDNYIERVNYLTRWMNVIKDADPDVFMSGSDRNILDIIITMKQIQFQPKVAVTVQKEYIYDYANKLNLVNSNWHYFVEFDEVINGGTTGRYMGKTKDVIEYINNNIEKIPLDAINYQYNKKKNNDNDNERNDLLHILHGITFGITLQRIMELSSSSEVTNRIIYPQKINTHLSFSVIRSITHSLGSWNSFYGEIQFNTNGVNTAHHGYTFQIQYNQTDDDNNGLERIAIPISPSTVPNCNLNKKNCTNTNNYGDCSCNVIYPANWEWKSSQDNDYIKFSSAFGIIFLLIDICLIICFLSASLLVIRRIFSGEFPDIQKTPPIYLISAFFYIFYSIYELGERNAYMCKSSSFFNCCATWYIYLALLFTMMGENDKLNGFSKDPRNTYFRLFVIQSFYLVIFLIMNMGYGADSVKIETLVDDISPLVYYKCDSDIINEMCFTFLFHIFCIFYYRNKMSSYFRGFHYHFTFISSLPVVYKPFILYVLDEGKSQAYLKVTMSSLMALFIILPFFFVDKFLCTKSTEELYFTHSDSLRCIKKAFKHSSIRNFLKCSLEKGKANDAMLLDIIGDIKTLLKTKDAKESQDLAKEMVIKYFDEDINPFITKEFADLFKEKVDKPQSIKKELNAFVNRIAEDFANKHYWEIFLNSEYHFDFDNFHLFLNSLRKKSIRTLNGIHEELRVSIIVENTKDVNIFREHVKHYNEDLRNRSNSSMFRSKRDRSSVRQSTVNSNIRVSLANSAILQQNKSQHIPVSPSANNNNNNNNNKNRPSQFSPSSTAVSSPIKTTKSATTTTTSTTAKSGGKTGGVENNNNNNKQQKQQQKPPSSQRQPKQQQQQQQRSGDNENTALMNSLAGFKSEGRYSSQRVLSTSGSDSENMVLNGQASGDSSNSHSNTPLTTNYESHKPSTPHRSGVFSYSNALSSGRDTSVKDSEAFSKAEISRYSNKDEKEPNDESTCSLSNKMSYTNNETED